MEHSPLKMEKLEKEFQPNGDPDYVDLM